MTAAILGHAAAGTSPCLATRGNLNNHIGVPLTLLSVKKDAQFAVIEMGANHQREIAGYCEYARPTHGIITNAGLAHLEGFGGAEGVKKGKGELYDFLRQTGGAAFVMWDYDYLREMSKGIPEIITYGSANADYTGTAERGAGQGADGAGRNDPFLTVNMTHGASTGLIHTQLVGDYNLPNVLVAVAVGKHFGVPDEKIRQAIEQYAPSNSRSQLIQKDGNQFILDAYNANPSSMRAAIENFARMPEGGKVLVLGAMAELGPGSVGEHRRIIDLIRQYPWKEVALVGGDFLKTDHPWQRFENARQAGQWLKGLDLKNAYILIKGSRSMRMEEVLS
ncbi:MAG: UDP-N-acetylmuramoyl-tripeptide--D-alanyl-D-alanine ligase, partial [Bacteroidota bacterium]|nr:UDP-N-acetylmuramoyl-tripeptide--D-alanyl-D-alanine ligase [Bacteroidota bacterium]